MLTENQNSKLKQTEPIPRPQVSCNKQNMRKSINRPATPNHNDKNKEEKLKH